MDIDAGYSAPISQKPCILHLKHAMWVYQELETVRRVGVITGSHSSWASLIVVV